MSDDQDQDTVLVSIQPVLTEGMSLVDASGKRVGHVRAYNLAAGYMVVEGGVFHQRDYYVPVKAVVTIDQHACIASCIHTFLVRRATVRAT